MRNQRRVGSKKKANLKTKKNFARGQDSIAYMYL